MPGREGFSIFHSERNWHVVLYWKWRVSYGDSGYNKDTVRAVSGRIADGLYNLPASAIIYTHRAFSILKIKEDK